MAAVTVASSHRYVAGNRRVLVAKLTTPADGDTWATGFVNIDYVGVTPVATTISTADAFGVTSVSGGTVTFEVVGTAADLYVQVIGY